MSKGVEFYEFIDATPPFFQDRSNICGRHPNSGINFVVAHMWDYYSVGAEEQRRMAENTIALCELLYSQKEIANA